MSDETMAAVEQAEAVVAGTVKDAGRQIVLPPATQQRLRLLVAAEQTARQRTVDTLMTALEALGVEGQVLGYDPQAGVVKMAG